MSYPPGSSKKRSLTGRPVSHLEACGGGPPGQQACPHASKLERPLGRPGNSTLEGKDSEPPITKKYWRFTSFPSLRVEFQRFHGEPTGSRSFLSPTVSFRRSGAHGWQERPMESPTLSLSHMWAVTLDSGQPPEDNKEKRLTRNLQCNRWACRPTTCGESVDRFPNPSRAHKRIRMMALISMSAHPPGRLSRNSFWMSRHGGAIRILL